MQVEVYNIKGEKTSKKVKLSDEIFAIEPNDHAIYLDVKQYLANQRQGTAKSKQRNEISGSTRKLHKQKGTGGSRKGSIKNPLFRGGGTIFGPQPRDYGFKLNKKVKQLARKSSLTYKAKENGIVILENFSMETPKTKEFVSILKNLEIGNRKSLVVVPEAKSGLYLSARNIPNTKLVFAENLNTYDIMNSHKVVVLEGAVEKIENLFN
ncbi:MAG: 50S ribosomal protein L4 [Flavobacteriales bacterium]